MSMTRLAFNTRAVGQGLFHTGRFRNPTSDFTFVYDCGAVRADATYLRREVEVYKAEEHSDPRAGEFTPLDLLVLSHLHFDHMAGIPELLRGMPVHFAVMPYLAPVERLFLASLQDDLEEWYTLALGDPTSYLLRNGVEKVVLLSPGNSAAIDWPRRDNGNRTRDESLEGRPGDREAIPWRIDPESFRLPEDRGALVRIRKTDPDVVRALDAGDAVLKSHRGHLAISNRWGFKFYTLPIEESMLTFLKDMAGELIGRSITDDAPLTKAELVSILAEPDAASFLRSVADAAARASKQLRRNINNSSVLLYHAPIDGSVRRIRVDSSGPGGTHFGAQRHADRSHLYSYPRSDRYGHFLLGDIDLTDSDLLAAARDHFSDTPSDCDTFQVPHHGSRENWSDEILSLLGAPGFCVISAGVGSEYKHPSPSVISQLLDSGLVVFWANQFCRVRETGVYFG